MKALYSVGQKVYICAGYIFGNDETVRVRVGVVVKVHDPYWLSHQAYDIDVAGDKVYTAVPENIVFFHEPKPVKVIDEFGEFTRWQ